MAVQLTVALVVVMLEELKPVGMPQLAAVVNDVAVLFELDPDLELLFKGNLTEQGRKLMQMLGLAVSSLDRMEQLLPVVRSLGTRHVGYGVRDKDYDTVGRALLWTLRKGLGEAFTPDVEGAWSNVYRHPRNRTKSGSGTRPEAVVILAERI